MVDLPEKVLVLWNKNLYGSLGLRTPTRDQFILTRNLSELSWQKRFWKMIWLRSGFSLQKVRKSMEFSMQKLMRSGLSSPKRNTQKSSNLLTQLMPRRSVTCDLITATLPRYGYLFSSKPADLELQYAPNFQEQYSLGSSLISLRRLFLRFEKEYGSPVAYKQLLKNSVFSLVSDENASNPLENTAKSLQYVFEVQKLESTIDIERNQANILEGVRNNIQVTIVSENLLISHDERRHDFLVFVQALAKDPATNGPIEDLQRVVQMLHNTSAYFFSQSILEEPILLVSLVLSGIRILFFMFKLDKYPNIFLDLTQNESTLIHRNCLPSKLSLLLLLLFQRYQRLTEAVNTLRHADSIAFLFDLKVLWPIDEYLCLLDIYLDWFALGRWTLGVVDQELADGEAFHYYANYVNNLSNSDTIIRHRIHCRVNKKYCFFK